MTLEIKDIRFTYGSTPVLHGLSLEIARGQFTALLGPNGSGKSTLTKIVARVLKPTSGEILLDGRDLLRLRRRQAARLVAYVPQSSEAPFDLSVEEAVMLGRTPHISVRPNATDRAAVDEAIELLGLEALRERDVSELSGGQSQRVSIARALAQAPQVLLLDEPTSALDLRYQIETLSLIREITQQRGISALIAIHDLSHAAFFCDQAVLLRGGSIVAAGAPADALTSETLSAVYELDVVVDDRDGRTDIRPGIFDRGRTSTRPALARAS